MFRKPWVSALIAGLLCAGQGVVVARPVAPQPVSLNFPNTDVDAVARAMAAIMGRPVVVDPRVVGKITLYTDTPVSSAQAHAMFAAALRGAGYALVESQGLLKVVPEAEGKVQAGSLRTDGSAPGQDVVGTQVFRLQHENASSMVTVLRPLISANNTINVNAGNNSLVITDYASNLRRLERLIAALDTPSATDVEVLPLQHAMASQLAYTVQKLVDGGGAASPQGGGAGSAGQAVSVVADVFSNALLVRAPNQARLATVRALVARLDQAGAGTLGGSNVHVVYLQHADATRLAPVLRASFAAPAGRMGGSATSGGDSGGATAGGGAAMASSGGAGDSGSSPGSGGGSASGKGGGTGGSAQAAAPATALAQPVTGGYIQAEPASNALIITAPMALFRQIQAVIAQLDTPRAQVYVESLVVEVDASRSYDVGVKWKEIFNISSSTELTLGTVASAVASMSGTNILSTANVVTLDNEEARIVVGQNVPFVTGSYTSSSSGSTNPFQTIERKDVGITLRIKPQIGADGRIRMGIYQESSSVSSTAVAGTSNAGPTTNTRAIDTHVVVKDGHIIVLGGLIEDSATTDASVMPGMWDIPVLGALFRNQASSRSKRNLVVFLRPHVMSDVDATDATSLDRYALIRARQQTLPSDPLKVLQSGEGEEAPPLLSEQPAMAR